MKIVSFEVPSKQALEKLLAFARELGIKQTVEEKKKALREIRKEIDKAKGDLDKDF